MTFESEEIIETILRNNGSYPGDPPAASVWQYEAMRGQVCYAVFMPEQYCDIHDSQYVRKPVKLFELSSGLTPDGENWLQQRNDNRKAKAIKETLE
jgi:hypothetical protein